MKFSGITCPVIKNVCGKFCCKQTNTRKVIALTFINVNPHPVYSIEWHIYPSFRTLCIWTYGAYLRQPAPKVWQNNSSSAFAPDGKEDTTFLTFGNAKTLGIFCLMRQNKSQIVWFRPYSLNTTITFYSVNEWSNLPVSVWLLVGHVTMHSHFI